jgi:hypothetical protein
MQLTVEIGLGGLVVALLVIALGIWRIGRVTSWRSLAMIARATGSFEECVWFIRFCARNDSTLKEPGHFLQRRRRSLSWAPAQSFEDLRQLSR